MITYNFVNGQVIANFKRYAPHHRPELPQLRPVVLLILEVKDSQKEQSEPISEAKNGKENR